MLVHPVVIPGSGTRSWTVLGDDDLPVAPVDRFLAYLTDIGRSPNTVKAYAHDLKDWWDYLTGHGVGWRSATLEDVATMMHDHGVNSVPVVDADNKVVGVVARADVVRFIARTT